MQQPDAHTMDYVLAIITVAALIIGLLSMLFGWLRERWWAARDWWQEGIERAKQKEMISPAVSASESKVSVVSPFLSDGETDADRAIALVLARLILAEELDITTAIKIGCNKKSGEGYQKWSRLIRTAMEQQAATPIAHRPTAAKFAEHS